MRMQGIVTLTTAGVLALSHATLGQTIQERLTSLEKKVAQQAKGIGGALGVDVHALVAADFLWNFNDPDSDSNAARVFDEDANTFTLNHGNVWIGRQREDEDFGFAVNMDFGETAEVVGRATRWSNGASSESNNSFELREAYLTYKAPIGDGVTLKAGKFVTLHGAEIIKNYNGFNYTVSNSILFGYAIPFTHTGLMASFPLGDVVSVDLGVVNGWDNVADNNDGKSIHGGIKIAPVDAFSIYLSGIWGPEQSPISDGGPGAGSKRTLGTALFTIAPTDQLTFIIDGNYGYEDGLGGFTASDDRQADWYGVAGYVIVSPDERVSFTLRGEIFDDPDGVRGLNATVWEVTPAVSFKLTDTVWLRAEYRHDEASEPIFSKDDRAQSGQDTVAAELLFAL